MKKIKNMKIDYYSIVRVLAAVLIAFIVASVIILGVSDEPVTAITKLFLGPLQSKRNFFNVIEMMIPLVFTGLALNIMFKSGLFNMGADGAFYMGAVVATYVAIKFALPAGIHQGVVIVLAGITGGIIGTIPAILKKITGANELVTSLMFNYVFFNLGLFTINNFLLDETTGYASYKFLKTAKLGNMIQGTQLHYGFVIMVVTTIIMYFVVEKSSFGYKLKLTGSNKKFAMYSGIGVTSTIMGAQFIGGTLAGMGGAIEMVGMNNRFTWIKPVNYVWDGILVNLLANSKPAFIPLAAMFISYIRVGSDIMSRGSDVDSELIAIIQCVIILLVASERFMYKMKQKKEEKEALENSKLESAVN